MVFIYTVVHTHTYSKNTYGSTRYTTPPSPPPSLSLTLSSPPSKYSSTFLFLECQIECSYWKVDSLREGLAHVAEQVENVLAFASSQAGEQLWYPWQPIHGENHRIVLVDGLCKKSTPTLVHSLTIYSSYIVHVKYHTVLFRHL